MVLATLTRESAGRVRRLQIGKRSPRRAPGAGGCLLRTCAGSTTRVPSAPEWSWRRSHVNPPVEFDVFHDADAGGVQALDGGVRLVEAEDQHGLVLAPESEGVHVLDID